MSSGATLPREKVDLALRLVYLVKPWWRRYGSQVKILPMSVPSGSEDFGGMSFCDEDMNLYLDCNFASSAPIEELAGVIEHELQLLARNCFKRIPWAQTSTERRVRKVALELEVNAAIQSESGAAKWAMKAMLDSQNPGITQFELDKHHVVGPPRMPGSTWVPEMIGLQSDLSAESYYDQMLNLGLFSPEENEDEQEYPEQPDESNLPNEDEDQDAEETDQGHSEAPISSSGDDETDEEPENQEGSGGEQPGRDQESPGSDSRDDLTGEGSLEAQGKTPEKTEAEAEEPEAGPPGSLDELIDLMRSDPQLDWWSQDPSGMDRFVPEEVLESEQQTLTEREIREAQEELADDLRGEYPGWGVGTSPSLTQMYSEVNRPERVFIKKLERVLDSVITSNVTMGAADLSYSVPNPNQPKFGPILMGSYSYEPQLAVMIDNSGSMRTFVGTTLGAVSEVAATMNRRYGATTHWLTADSEVNAFGTTRRLDENTMEKLARGGGGTSFGPVLERIVAGKLKLGNRRLEKPDVLLVVTDCHVYWPWKNLKRCPSGTHVVVCSVLEFESVTNLLPNWVRPENKTFVEIKLPKRE